MVMIPAAMSEGVYETASGLTSIAILVFSLTNRVRLDQGSGSYLLPDNVGELYVKRFW